ncbi:hypothetical protein [Arthrobacter sp. D5-1]|uniref:hypothetical protein n=1 Tax=Arthrobacter sp. D5-1 TaxID=1477518 RepID=UPI001A9A02FE|nr:hypothetical protein [Arthrobacter sp. D5-1]QSZ51240.1 hypothetical protein AYX22_22125 [Arthrobacter sp. D5-1]
MLKSKLSGLMTGLLVLLLLVSGAEVPASAAVHSGITASADLQTTESRPEALAGAPMSVPTLSYRPGARFGQIDILLDEVETARVAKSPWGGSVYCWPAAVGVFAGGLAASASAVAFGACLSIVTVCAAQAYLSQPRKRAAMTLTIWGGGWCWKY